MPGYFLTFEGLDGCGKTTQLQLFADYLARLRLPFLLTREPGGTDLGERIRELLLSQVCATMDPHTELLLLFAARAQNVAEVIRPALQQGTLVLCDRFTDASLAYQGYGRGLDRRFIRQLNRFACQGLKPNLSFVIDIDPRTCLERAERRNQQTQGHATYRDRFEQQTLAFYQRVRRGYHQLARQEPRRVQLIPGEHTIEEVHQTIVARARRLIAVAQRRRRATTPGRRQAG